MNDKIISVIAQIRAKQGNEGKLEAELRSLVGPSRAESGCIDFYLHRSADDKGLFFFYENWKSQADLDKHLQEPHVTEFLAKGDELLAEPISATFWNPIS